MPERPFVEQIEARNVVVVGRDVGSVRIPVESTGITVNLHAGNNIGKVALTFASGTRIERVFASVPAPGPSLVGRETTISQLRSSLATGGRVALSALKGIPGVGKTALALELAYDEETLRHFP